MKFEFTKENFCEMSDFFAILPSNQLSVVLSFYAPWQQ